MDTPEIDTDKRTSAHLIADRGTRPVSGALVSYAVVIDALGIGSATGS